MYTVLYVNYISVKLEENKTTTLQKKKKDSVSGESPELREGVGKTLREQGPTPTRVPHSWERVAI